jgi:hypothetical protein
VVGDLVLIGIFHLGAIAPAIATAGAMLVMLVAFGVYARRLVPGSPYPDLIMGAPLAAGMAPTLVWGGSLGALLGLGAGVGAAFVVLAWRRPFRREDAVMVEKLDLPPRVKGALVSIIGRIASS